MLVMLANLSACKSDSDDKYPDDQITDMGKTIITCFEEKDKEALISLFSENIKNSHDLEKEIEQAFEFFDSEIVEYDGIHGGIGGGKTRGEEGWIEMEGSGDIDIIKTESGTNYRIGFQVCLIDKENEENVGLYRIYIINQDIGEEYGCAPERFREIGEQ